MLQVTSHTKHTINSSIILHDMEYLHKLRSVPRLGIYYRDAPLSTGPQFEIGELDRRFSRDCSINMEFGNVRATLRPLGQAHHRDCRAKEPCERIKKEKRRSRRKRARTCVREIDRGRRSQRGGSSGRSNETDSQAATARPPMSRTSHLQSTTSSQAQIKCSLYPPCFPTTITNHHHRHHHQRRGCRCRCDTGSACSRSSRFTVASRIVRVRPSLCRGPRILRPPLGPRGERGRFERLRKRVAPRRADVLSALIRPFRGSLCCGRKEELILARLIDLEIYRSRDVMLIY